MELKKAPIWEVVEGCKTIESFQKNIIGDYYLHPSIQKEIRTPLELVVKLLLHSYYEYEFLDLALLHSIITLEKAIKLKWASVKNTKSPSFEKLLQWCLDNSYFESRNNTWLNTLRRIRNGKVHDSAHSVGGLIFLAKVKNVFDLINDLYEDVELRLDRFDSLREAEMLLYDLTKKGSIVEYQDKRFIIHKAFVEFISNKAHPKQIHIMAFPIFDLSPYQNDKLYTPYSNSFSITNWKFDNDSFEGVDKNNGIVRFQRIDDINLKKYDNWKVELQEIKEAGLIEVLMNDERSNFFQKVYRENMKVL